MDQLRGDSELPGDHDTRNYAQRRTEGPIEGCIEPRTGREVRAGDDDRVARVIEVAAAPLCKRWKHAIIWLMGAGHHRFNALAQCLPGVSSKVLAEQLRELVRDEIVIRHEIPGGAKHVDYTLTSNGESLLPMLDLLAAWGREYQRVRRGGAEHPTAANPARADQQPHRHAGLPPHKSDADIGITRIDDRHYR